MATRTRPVWMCPDTEFQLHWTQHSSRGNAWTELDTIECCCCGATGKDIRTIDHAADCVCQT